MTLLEKITEKTENTKRLIEDSYRSYQDINKNSFRQAIDDVPVCKDEQDLRLNKILNTVIPGSGTIRATWREDQYFTRSAQLWVGLM